MMSGSILGKAGSGIITIIIIIIIIIIVISAFS